MNVLDVISPYTEAIKIGAVCIAVVGVFFAGEHVENISWQFKWDEAVAKQASDAAIITQKYREKEQQYVKQLADVDEQLRKQQDENDARINSIIHDNSLRLRKHFTCPTSGVSQGSSSSSVSDGPSEGGLRKDDEGFLIRFAGRCQATADQLTACQQALIKAQEISK